MGGQSRTRGNGNAYTAVLLATLLGVAPALAHIRADGFVRSPARSLAAADEVRTDLCCLNV